MDVDNSLSTFNHLLFMEEHPQYCTHCLKPRAHKITPVVMGMSIPRRDKPENFEKYSAAMLTLFKPWNRNVLYLLKDPMQTWSDSFSLFQQNVPTHFRHIMNHMQEVYECHDAADDFSAQRKK
ncbi:hypothetical protein K439DRAFT_1370292, partial [Ramaria rubella]